MKKRILSLTLAALMTAAMPLAAFAELTDVQKTVKVGAESTVLVDDVFSYGNVWAGGGALAYDPVGADNLKSDGTYTWIESLYASKDPNGSQVYNSLNIYKEFASPSANDTLELEAVLQPHKSGPEKGCTVQLTLENDDASKKFTVFTYSVNPWAGSKSTIADGNNATNGGNETWDINVHNKDVKVAATIKPSNGKFAAKVVLTDSNGTVLLESDEVELAKNDVRAFSKVKLAASANWCVTTRKDDDKVLGIKSVKLTKTNSKGILYSDTGVRLNERMYDFNVNLNTGCITATDWGGTLTEEQKKGGNAWSASATAFWNKAFVNEDGYFWGKHHEADTSGVFGTVRRHFDPIEENGTLTMSFDFKVSGADTAPQSHNFGVSLTNEDQSQRLNVLTHRVSNNLWNTDGSQQLPYSVGVGAVNSGIGKCGALDADSGYSAYVNAWRFVTKDGVAPVLYNTKDYRLEMTLMPQGDAYAAMIVVRNMTDGTQVEGLTNTSAPLTVSKDIVEALNTVELSTYSTWGFTSGSATDGYTANKYLGVRNIKLEADNYSAATALTTGENKLYVPYEKVSKEPLTAVICAAVVNGDGVQTDFDVVPLDEVIKNKDNVELTVNVTNADTDYVRVFVFDSLKGLTPLRGAMKTE